MTRIVPKPLFVVLMVRCFLIGAVPLRAQGYNSPDDTPDISLGGHAWITNKAIEYLKAIAPDAYLLANQYREQLIDGARHADHNSGRCGVDASIFGQASWPCDSINHYEPKFRCTKQKIPFLDQGAEASVSASEYASDLLKLGGAWDDTAAKPAGREVVVRGINADLPGE
jgi:hypothetical protein